MFQDEERKDAVLHLENGIRSSIVSATGYVSQCQSKSGRIDDSTPGVDIVHISMTTTIANSVYEFDVDTLMDSMRVFEMKRYHDKLHTHTHVTTCVLQTGVAIALGEPDVSQLTVSCVAHFDRPVDEMQERPPAPPPIIQPSWFQRASSMLWRRRESDAVRVSTHRDDRKSIISGTLQLADRSRDATDMEEMIKAFTRIHREDARTPAFAYASIHDGMDVRLKGYTRLNLFDVYRFVVQHRSFIAKCMVNPRVRYGEDIIILNLSHRGVDAASGGRMLEAESSCLPCQSDKASRRTHEDDGDGRDNDDESIRITKRARTNEWSGQVVDNTRE